MLDYFVCQIVVFCSQFCWQQTQNVPLGVEMFSENKRQTFIKFQLFASHIEMSSIPSSTNKERTKAFATTKQLWESTKKKEKRRRTWNEEKVCRSNIFFLHSSFVIFDTVACNGMQEVRPLWNPWSVAQCAVQIKLNQFKVKITK